MGDKRVAAIVLAVLAAAFYAVNMPAAKSLLRYMEPTMLAACLYLGAGTGIGAVSFITGRRGRAAPLDRRDLPYTVGMIALDIAAPVCLMFGLMHTTSANASLLNNFEIVATSVIALAVFREAVSKRLWTAIALIALASAILSFEDISGLKPSWGSLLVLLAAVCWGFENNCTRCISSKDTYEIVTLKGIFSGLGALIVALLLGERIPAPGTAALALLLGFVSYGLSIFCYVRAQNVLGAAKTSAYYAVAPFLGAGLSFLLLREPLTLQFAAALAVMLAGSVLVVADTLILHHTHLHTHTITHTHDGSTHTHTYTHSHEHSHFGPEEPHSHPHGAFPHDHGR